MSKNLKMFTCKKCGESKAWEEFCKSKECKDGIWKCCKKCNSKNYLLRYHANPDPVKRATKKWQEKNKEHCRQVQSRWQRESLKRKLYEKTWGLANKDKRNDQSRLRRSKNSAIINARAKIQRDAIDTGYAIHLLRIKGFTTEYIRNNIDLINTQKALLSIKRLNRVKAESAE